jgi:hypothetical protein
MSKAANGEHICKKAESAFSLVVLSASNVEQVYVVLAFK